MNKTELFQSGWQFRPLLWGNLLALALLGFWVWPTGHALCTQFDEWLFALLNHPLAQNNLWRHIFLVGSLRPFDLVMGVIMLVMLIKGDWVFKASDTRAAILGFLVLLVLMLLIRLAFDNYVDAMGWQHDSPSMVLPGAVHLSDLFPNLQKGWALKDRSGQSFPGDHASVLLIWALFMTTYSRTTGQRVAIWVVTLLFMMPRLVAGAHWGQDDYIGGVMMAVLGLVWGMYTPLAAWCCNGLLRLTAPLFRLFQKLPVVRQLAVIRYPQTA